MAILSATQNPRDKAIAEFLLARCMLVRNCARPLSLFLAGDKNAREPLTKETAALVAQLDVCEKSLASSNLEDEKVATLRSELAMLRSFADTFVALAGDPASEHDRKRLLDATIGLALYLDDTRKEVIESARLWQGVAYRMAGRPDRALQVLRPVLPSPAARRIGLWSRIERCRALADNQQHAAALALAARLGPRVDAWFEGEDTGTRRAAADSVRWLKAELLTQWASKLSEAGEADRAEQAMEDAKLILSSDKLPIAPDRWLPLDESLSGIMSRKDPTPTTDVAEEDE